MLGWCTPVSGEGARWVQETGSCVGLSFAEVPVLHPGRCPGFGETVKPVSSQWIHIFYHNLWRWATYVGEDEPCSRGRDPGSDRFHARAARSTLGATQGGGLVVFLLSHLIDLADCESQRHCGGQAEPQVEELLNGMVQYSYYYSNVKGDAKQDQDGSQDTFIYANRARSSRGDLADVSH